RRPRSSRPRTARCMRARMKDGACRRSTIPARTDGKRLGDDVRRKLILDQADLVAQDELALLQSLYLNEVGTGRGHQGRYRRVEVTVFLQQARQLLPQSAFFFVVHRHRWYFLLVFFAWPPSLGKSMAIIAFSTSAFKLAENRCRSKVCACLPQRRGGCTVALVMSLR